MSQPVKTMWGEQPNTHPMPHCLPDRCLSAYSILLSAEVSARLPAGRVVLATQILLDRLPKQRFHTSKPPAALPQQPPSAAALRSTANMAAAKRLRKELDDMAQNPEPFCTASPVGDDLFAWQAVLTGPPDSPYDGGRFVLELRFPPNYPHSPPKARVATRGA